MSSPHIFHDPPPSTVSHGAPPASLQSSPLSSPHIFLGTPPPITVHGDSPGFPPPTSESSPLNAPAHLQPPASSSSGRASALAFLNKNIKVPDPYARPEPDSDGYYCAERILSRRRIDGTALCEYLVRWTGYPPDCDSWEPRENLSVSLLETYDCDVDQLQGGSPPAPPLSSFTRPVFPDFCDQPLPMSNLLSSKRGRAQHKPRRRRRRPRGTPAEKGPGDALIFDAMCFLNMCDTTHDIASRFSDDPSNQHPFSFVDCLPDDCAVPRAAPLPPSSYRHVYGRSRWDTRVSDLPLSVENLVATVTFQEAAGNKGCVEMARYDDYDPLSSLFNDLHLSPVVPIERASITLATYNCNGLANLVRKGYFRRFLSKHTADILLLTEVKMSLKRLFSFKALHVLLKSFGYGFCYYNPQIVNHGGLHGTAIISKLEPLHVSCGFFDMSDSMSDSPTPPNGDTHFSPIPLDDAKLSMDLDGRCISAVFDDFIVVNTYTPCSGLSKPDRPDKDVFAKDAFRKRYETALLLHCENLKRRFERPLVLGGDLNVTATRRDCFYRRGSPLFPGNKSWERDGFSHICKSLDLVDAFRHFHKSPTSNDCTYWYTADHWKRKSGLRLDYFLVPPSWSRRDSGAPPGPLALDCYLDRNVRGSDHCPVFLTLSLPDKPSAGCVLPVSAIHCDLKRLNVALTPEAFIHSDTRAPNVRLNSYLGDSLSGSVAEDVSSLCSAVEEFSISSASGCPDHGFLQSDSISSESVDDALYDPILCAGGEYAFDKWADSDGPPDYCLPQQPVGCRHTRRATTISSVRRACAVHASVPVADVGVGTRSRLRLRTLFDTGAACSILSFDALSRLRQGGNPYPLNACGDSGPVFSLANGDTVRPVGWLDIHLYFNNRAWVHKVYVLRHSNFDLLLGVDFMSRSGASISFQDQGKGLITFRKILGDSSVPFVIKKHHTFRGSAAPLVIPQDLALKPRTQYTLGLDLLQDDDLFGCNGLHGQVDRCVDGTDARHRVPTGISAVRNGSVVCQVSNFTNKPSFLPAGSVVAYFRPAWVVPPDTHEHMDAEDVCLVSTPDANTTSRLLCAPDHVFDDSDSREPEPLNPIYLDEDDDKEPAVFDDAGLHVDLAVKLQALKAAGRLSRTQYKRLKTLLIEYRDIFADKDSSPQVAKHVEAMRIDIPPDSVPFAAPLRRYNPKERLLLIEHATRLLKHGVLERCNSAWRAQPLMIPKKDGGYRVALSYVRLNAMTKPVAANLPNLQDSLDSLGGCGVFTSCDILSAYYTCDLHEPHRDYTAFFVPTLGNLRFTRASMGLRNSQAYFVNLTMKMLQGLMFDCVVAYSDDLVCYSTTMDKHICEDLPKLFSRLREYNVKLKASKVELCTTQFSWCGMVVSKDGVTPDPSKIAAIDAIDVNNITTLKKLRSFVGSCNFLRRWVPKYSDVVDPLRILFKKGMFRKASKWSDKQKIAFQELKNVLKKAPVMAHPDFSKPFYIYCDASRTAVAGALIQFDKEGDESTAKVVSYLSKALNSAQQNYVTHEQECLALLYCLETWRSYLFGQAKVTVYTDSKAVEWMCKPTSTYSGRCLRWILRASEWPLDVQHRSGITHYLPDMLTRCVSDCYSQRLKMPIEPLYSLSSGTPPCPRLADKPLPRPKQRGLPVNVSTRAMSRRNDARPLGQDAPPDSAECPMPAPTPSSGAPAPSVGELDDLRYSLPDGSFRVRREPFICYNCRAPHPGGEWRCTHPCRSCGSRGHTRFACPQRVSKLPPRVESKTSVVPPVPRPSSDRSGKVPGAGDLPCGDRNFRPFRSLFPEALDPQHILSLRKEIVLLHQVQDRKKLFLEHQSRDPFCMKVASALTKAVCRDTCSGCSHHKSCPHYYWCYDSCGILMRKSFREPLVSPTASARIMEKLRAIACRCKVSSPKPSCVHHSYIIRGIRSPPSTRRRRKRLRKDTNGSGSGALDIANASKRVRPGDEAVVAPDAASDAVPANHLFSHRDVSSFDKSRIIKGFDKLLVCPRTYKLVVPATLVTSILFDLHGSLVNGHCGITTCRARARSSYWWKGMHKDITRWISACLTCKRRKPGRLSAAGPVGVMDLPPRPFHTIHIDHSGPWPPTKDKNTYILSVVDPYSRWPISVPVSSRKAYHVIRVLLEYVVAQYASPELMVSDGAPEFISKALADFCRVFNIKHRVNPPYSPSLNAPVERFHDWLNAMLTVLVSRNKTNWDRMLPLVLFNYRTSPIAGVGLSPYQILYNRDPRLPSQLTSAWNTPQSFGDPDAAEIHDVATAIRDIVTRAHDSYVYKRLSQRSTSRAPEYSLGDFCLTYSPKTEIVAKGVSSKPKLRDRWSHPRMVIAKGRRNTYIVQDANGKVFEARPDLMVPYHFYWDGKPSIGSRPRHSAAERRTLASDPSAYVPPVAAVGDLVIFPMSLEDDDAFGVGRVVTIDAHGHLNLHWYGNKTDNLFGTYCPLWMRPDRTWYSSAKSRSLKHTPILTGEYFDGEIAQSDLADVGFSLQNHRLPREVLQRISDDPRYGWCLEDDQ